MTAKKEKDTDYWLLFAEAGVPHGIKGAFFLMTTDRRTEAVGYSQVGVGPALASPRGIAELPPIKPYRVRQSYTSGGRVVIALEGIESRQAAELLLGSRLYVARDNIQVETGEFLVGDLIGTLAFDDLGNCIGSVVALHNFGAQTNLEICISPAPAQASENRSKLPIAATESTKTFYFPFLEQFILNHDPVAKTIVLKNISDFLD